MTNFTFKQFLKLSEENDSVGDESILTIEEIKEIWKKVFPESAIFIRGSCEMLGKKFKETTAKTTLAKDKTEVSGGYFENDLLSYSFSISGSTYKEDSVSISVNPPQGSYIAMGREKLRSKTIKNIDAKKLEKRFIEIKNFIKEHKDNLYAPSLKFLDIDSKLG